MSIQMYGQWSSYGSFANVSRAISRMIRQRRLDGQVYGIGEMNPTYIDTYLPVGMDSSAGIGLCVSYPEAAPSWLNGHDQKILVTVCETDKIPGSWVAACNQMSLVIVPSKWCRDAFMRSGVTAPVHVVNHGVDHVMSAVALEYNTEPNPIFLHVSGSLSFAGRKGTIPLLRAFKEFVKDFPLARLILKVPPTAGYQKALRMLEIEDSVSIVGELNPSGMTAMLTSVDAVVQPSRAEGFGLCPLEARCLGTPVIATNTTGHAEYFDPDIDTLIESGPESRLETQANPVGAAPTVTSTAVYIALKDFMRNRKEKEYRAFAWAAGHGNLKWKWENVLIPLARELKSRYSAESISLGAKSSLRGA